MTRVAVPMVAGWPLLFVGVFLAFGWADTVVSGGIAPDRPSRLWLHPAAREPGAFYLLHLWFLYFLLIFYAVTLMLIAAAVLWPRVETALRRTGELAAAAMRSVFAPFLLAAPLAIALHYEPVWLVWFGIPAPDKNLIPDQPALVGYATAFAAGWLLHARPELLRLLETRWPTNAMLATSLVVAAGLIAGPESIYANAPTGWLNVALAGLYASAAFAATFAVVGAAHRFLNGASAWRRYLADASYWIYLVHLPLVMALQVMLCTLSWPAWFKLLVILGIALPLMLASYQLLVRGTVIGLVLNGRRRPARPAPPALALGEAQP